MHPSMLAKYNLQPHEADLAKAWWQALKNWGWNETQIDQAFQWYGNGGVDGVSDFLELASRFDAFAEQAGIPTDVKEGAFLAFDIFSEQGPEAFNSSDGIGPLSGDAERRQEIEEIMRSDNRRYWRDDALQREYYEILERSNGVHQEVSPDATGNDAGRKAEILEIMRTDGRKYWNSPTLQKEYQQIVERQTGAAEEMTDSTQGAVENGGNERNSNDENA